MPAFYPMVSLPRDQGHKTETKEQGGQLWEETIVTHCTLTLLESAYPTRWFPQVFPPANPGLERRKRDSQHPHCHQTLQAEIQETHMARVLAVCQQSQDASAYSAPERGVPGGEREVAHL